jgi:hypothetical protein
MIVRLLRDPILRFPHCEPAIEDSVLSSPPLIVHAARHSADYVSAPQASIQNLKGNSIFGRIRTSVHDGIKIFLVQYLCFHLVIDELRLIGALVPGSCNGFDAAIGADFAFIYSCSGLRYCWHSLVRCFICQRVFRAPSSPQKPHL